MKAVRAYTCIDPDEERKIIVVSDDGEHYPFSIRLVDFCYIGEDMSPYDPAPDDWIASCTNIQPVELPDKEEV